MRRDDGVTVVSGTGVSQVGDQFVRPEKRIHPEIISLGNRLVSFVGGFGSRVPAERGRGKRGRGEGQ